MPSIFVKVIPLKTELPMCATAYFARFILFPLILIANSRAVCAQNSTDMPTAYFYFLIYT